MSTVAHVETIADVERGISVERRCGRWPPSSGAAVERGRQASDRCGDGSLLEEFEIPHTAAGFEDFFARIEGHAKRHP